MAILDVNRKLTQTGEGGCSTRRNTKSMRRLALLAVLLCLPALSAPAFRYSGVPCITTQNSGAPANKIDIVIIGDGYNKEDRRKFETDARLALDELWRTSPFTEYRTRFNVHLVPIESRVPTRGRAATAEHYAFGSHLDSTGQDMVIVETTHFLEAAHNAPDVDVVVALTTVAGRANAHNGALQDNGRNLPSIVLTRDDYPALAHELGHGIGHLGDEYESTSKLADRRPLPPNPTEDLGAPNLSLSKFLNPASRETVRKTAKWGHFLDLPDSYPLVSAYQGGYHQTIGVWRPSYRCVMRSTQGIPFCPVCHEELVKQIVTRCGEKFDDTAYHKQFPLKRWK